MSAKLLAEIRVIANEVKHTNTTLATFQAVQEKQNTEIEKRIKKIESRTSWLALFRSLTLGLLFLFSAGKLGAIPDFWK